MSDLDIRAYADTDETAVLELLALGLGKTADDRHRGLFRWKHGQNPFGRSFIWLGAVDGQLVGVRSFLRWRFLDPAGEPVEAVRAVDTATHPEFQGRGIFRALTLHGLDEMRATGVDFVFNTPNDQSRPANLTLGWEVEGRLPVMVRPRSLPSVWRMARARRAADVWSLPVEVGEPIADVSQWSSQPRDPTTNNRLITDRSTEFLSWRYAGYTPVASRALRVNGGAVLVRFRRRGSAVECTVGDVIGSVAPRDAGAAVRRAMSAEGADYAIATAATDIGGMVRVPRLGPIQTRRAVSTGPNRLPLSLTLGDVELF